METKIFFSVLILAVLLSGCVGQKNETDSPKDACIKKCNAELAAGRDLSSGPCLSNEIAKNWVCDVAHSPRTSADNEKENQCSSYGTTALHFVEVTPDCSFIRAV